MYVLFCRRYVWCRGGGAVLVGICRTRGQSQCRFGAKGERKSMVGRTGLISRLTVLANTAGDVVDQRAGFADAFGVGESLLVGVADGGGEEVLDAGLLWEESVLADLALVLWLRRDYRDEVG